jgi:hypothetical protein
MAYHDLNNFSSCLGCVTDWQQETRGLFLSRLNLHGKSAPTSATIGGAVLAPSSSPTVWVHKSAEGRALRIHSRNLQMTGPNQSTDPRTAA